MSDQPQKSNRRWKPSRRQFLIGLGTTTAALALGVTVGRNAIVREARLAINQAFLTGDIPLPDMPTSPFVWFEIEADNSAHLYIPKVEMGQGIHTALAQIAADELELDWQDVIVHQADTARGFDPEIIFTFGSTSVTALYQPIREIAATMREMFRIEGATMLNAALDEVRTEGGAIINGDERITYGDVIAAKTDEWQVPEAEAPLKANADFRYIGKSVKRVDFEAKITGQAVFGYDARAENMAYGAVARPPRFGATVASVDDSAARGMDGVLDVVVQEDFVGVVAETRTQAYAARDALVVEWTGGTTIEQDELEAMLDIPDEGGILIQRVGNTSRVADSGTPVEAEYFTPMAAHAHLEPQAGMADVQADGVTVYASTQSPGLTRDFVAAKLGIEDKNTITVIPTYLGGAFGRKTGTDAAVEAAILSAAIERPVHVGWTREEDMLYGYRRPPAHNLLRGVLDDDGQILSIEHEVASGDVFFYIQNLNGSTFLEFLLGADPLAAYGSLINYNVPNVRVLYHRVKLPVPTAFWRGLGSFPNTFAVETFIDELAATADRDPLDMRLAHLPDDELGERMRVALNTVAESCNWSDGAPEGRGRGLALAYDRGTVVALVAEISMEDDKVRVHETWCAVDPGFVVNPDGASAQVQGSIIMALSSTLFERLTVSGGMVDKENFNVYPLLTMRDTPNITVLPINSSDEPVGGLGEPVVGTVPAAVSNAIFALTGERRRRMPFNA